MPSSHFPLTDVFHIAERFTRSVNVASDYGTKASLEGYVVTSLTTSVMSRIVQGLNGTGGAWSITGPYGSGKSATILFAAEVLGYPVNTRARDILRQAAPNLFKAVGSRIPSWAEGGYLVVPMVGSHEPIPRTILTGLHQALAPHETHRPAIAQTRRNISKVLSHAGRDGAILQSDVIAMVEQTAKSVRETIPGAIGLLIVYDELGKTLEYAARHPDRSDVGILQGLAETAVRSKKASVALITILHQAFEHYAAQLRPVQQREWAKIQGRFEDIVFLESQWELLHLLDSAIQAPRVGTSLYDAYAAAVDRGESLGLLPTDVSTQESKSALVGCAPLHPTTVLTLTRLFRSRVAQNERTLFAFLSSGEPFGLQEYLSATTHNGTEPAPFYRLHNLYDYIVTVMGSAVYSQTQGKRWAEIDDALHRLPPDAPAIDANLVKTIGLLSLLGDQRMLKASDPVLAFALSENALAGETSIEERLHKLIDVGIVVYRRFNDTYALWQGSDVDLNERFDVAMTQIDRTMRLASLLEDHADLSPYVAKRHLHETGTFRYLEPWVVDAQSLDTVATRDFGQADGAVVFVLPDGDETRQGLIDQVVNFSQDLPEPRQQMLLFAVPEGLFGLRENFEEVLAWQWVARNTPDLEGDSIARRELSARLLLAEERLHRSAGRYFDPARAYRTTTWILAGQIQQYASPRHIAAAYSDVCDAVYHSAPMVLNELVNRRSLSSAASAARRSLIEAMLEHGTEPDLGIEGYPPEKSAYLSVLKTSGLHHQERDKWGFGPPSGSDPHRVGPLFDAIGHFLETTEAQTRPIAELYEVLRRPPFGIKAGLLPIYAVVAMLHWQAQLALYEEGSFVPQIQPAVCERLMRVPERFAVQFYQMDETRARMLYAYSTLFSDAVDPKAVTVLTAVRPVLGFANQLPRYTILTSQLSAEAVAARDVLFAAREPQPLLFRDLPLALGFEATPTAPEQVDAYFDGLKRVLLELQLAYDHLLNQIERKILDAMLLPNDLEVGREELSRRSQILAGWVSELDLKAFTLRLGDHHLARREWLESVAAVVSNKPPRQWADADAAHFEVALREMTGRFRRTEDLALTVGGQSDDSTSRRVRRLAVTEPSGEERREIISVDGSDAEQVSSLVATLEKTLVAGAENRALRLAALAELATRLLDDA
jgi:hypothetical protein